jgi:uncharacterized SAM-binding protein YcdF (DUF218 family)
MTYTQPLTLLALLIAALGLYGLRYSWRTISWWIAVCSFLGLVVLTWPPAAMLIAQPLVGRYAKVIRPVGDAEAIVVLSGAVNYPTVERPYALLGRDTYRRVMHAAWLFQNWKPLPILAAGGPQSGGSEAASVMMRRMLEQQGVPASKIWTEERSGSTYENALYSAKLLHDHGIGRIALVVEADSMLRAEKCFRKQGLAVTPAPCQFWDTQFGTDELLPGWQGIYRQEILLHENIGLLWYWLRGRI